MNKYFYILVLNLLTLVSFSYGEIIETAFFKEICNHVTPDTLVLLDIDDTLLIPKQTLGTDVWFIHRVKQHESTGISKHDAMKRAIHEWEAVRKLTDVQIVEEGSQKIIRDLQSQGIKVIALTTQGHTLANCTIDQLRSLGIDLKDSGPFLEEHYFMNGFGVLYKKGVLFTSGTPKGPALMKFLDHIRFQPKRVVFINDKHSHLADVEKTVLERGLEFIGLRYSIGDERVSQFNAELVDIQWSKSTLTHLLSDEEAMGYLSSTTITSMGSPD